MRSNKTMYRGLTAIALILMAQLSSAQSPGMLRSEIRPRVSYPLPFKEGETLSYDISVSKFIFSGTIGQLTLSVSKAGDEPKSGSLEFKAEVVSKGFLSKLVGLSVKDRYVSLVDPLDFGVLSSLKRIDQGKVKREQKSVIDRDADRVTYTDRDMVNRSAVPKVKEKAAPDWVQDLVSLCFFVRTQPLNRADVIPIPITDGGDVYNIEIVVGDREEVKIDAGKFKSIMLDAKIFDGRYVRRSGELFIWVTDDARRIPVKARMKTSSATAIIELKRMRKT
jgi:uncharacterized protein DUF3108